jgi:hypothetical protein
MIDGKPFTMRALPMEVSDSSVSARQRDLLSHGLSWSAVFGGAFVMAALSLIMLSLGAGFELSSVSPWAGVGASAATVGAVGILWLVVTQLISSAMGGYLAGRLRTRWETIHNDEIHFRDTANGFVAWAVAVVMTAGFLVTATTTMVGGANKAPQGDAALQNTNAYFIDRLFRSDHPGTTDDVPLRLEAGRLFVAALSRPDASGGDTAYLAQVVSARTGLSSSDASQRVSENLTEARQAADGLRRATAHLLLWTFVALLIGAFCASLAATFGGRQRDQVRLTT